MSSSQPPKVEPRLTAAQVEFMLTHVIRRIEIYNIAKAQLAEDYFKQDEVHLRMLWKFFTMMENDPGGLPLMMAEPETIKSRLWYKLSSVCEAGSAVVTKEVLASIIGNAAGPSLLDRVFDRKKFDSAMANGLLKAFLRERGVHDKLYRIFSQSKDYVLSDLPAILQKAREDESKLSMIDEDPVESGAPVGWRPPKLNKFPTGIAFMDQFLNGGHAKCETYGILGAFASGKTSLAVQLLYEGAFYQQRWAAEMTEDDPAGGPYYPKECYLFHYEATRDEIRVRLWSSVCSIDHEVLEEFDEANLTSMKNGYNSLRPYEREYFKEQKKDLGEKVIMGERERLETNLPLLNQNLWIIDMSGPPENPKRGTGYIPEVASIIQADLQRKEQASGRKHEVGVVIIDYAGICCRRFMSEHNKPLEHMRHYVGGFGDAARIQIAIRFQCPVWIFHQLSGQANKRTYQSQQHYSDAAESSSFAENLSFSFALGTKDDESNNIVLSCSKARRAKVGPPPLLTIEGIFYRLVTAKDYYYNIHTKRVEPKEVFVATGGKTPDGKTSADIPDDIEPPELPDGPKSAYDE